jgi:ribosomal protein S12 methylthiotransferase accessory factor
MKSDLALSPELMHVLKRVVHPQLGIIRDLREIPRYPDGAPIIIMNACLAEPCRFRHPPNPPNISNARAAGTNTDREACTWAAVGESLERYASFIYFDDELLLGTERELPGPAVAMDDFIVYSARQFERPGFKFRRYDPTKRRRWTSISDLRTGTERWIPADLIWFCRHANPDEYLLAGFSTGWAAGRSLQQAMQSGLYEVIERDSFAVRWIARESPTRLVPDDLESIVGDAELAAFFKKGVVELYLFWLRNEFNVPCVLALLKPATKRIVALGACAHHDPRRALRKAALEACQTWAMALELRRSAQPIEDASEIRSLRDHTLFYLSEANFHYLEFLFEGDELPVADFLRHAAPAGLEDSVEAIHRQGYTVLFKDLTTRDLEDLGFVAARAIVPGLQTLYVGRDMVHEDDRRVVRFLNWLGKPGALPDQIPPHPFA